MCVCGGGVKASPTKARPPGMRSLCWMYRFGCLRQQPTLNMPPTPAPPTHASPGFRTSRRRCRSLTTFRCVPEGRLGQAGEGGGGQGIAGKPACLAAGNGGGERQLQIMGRVVVVPHSPRTRHQGGHAFHGGRHWLIRCMSMALHLTRRSASGSCQLWRPQGPLPPLPLAPEPDPEAVRAPRDPGSGRPAHWLRHREAWLLAPLEARRAGSCGS